ncbi:MAG: DUF2029 domain-containing protein [Bacteroidia bacterium]|nr:DUF2029 domain-containing protein [Bacteroidia bacterium]
MKISIDTVLNHLYFKLFLGICLLIFILIEAQGVGDLNIYLSASRDILSHKNIYLERYNVCYQYYYSPLFALLLVPFSFLPLYVNNALWMLANVFFIYRIWKILISFLDVSDLPRKSAALFIFFSFLFILRPVKDNFHLTQITICILYLSLEGLQLIIRGKNFAGALLIALAINIKIIPVVLIPYLLYRNFLKSGASILFFFTIFLFLPVLIIGYKYNQFLLEEWWKLLNPMNFEHVIDVDERSFHGFSTLLPTLLMDNVPDKHALPLNRNIADMSFDQVSMILAITRLIFVLFTLYFLRSLPFRKAKNNVSMLWETGYILLIVPLIFPHQQHYAFFFIFPATTYLIYFLFIIYHKKETGFSKIKFNMVFTFMIITYLTVNLNVLLGEYKPYYEHYKILTWGTLLLIPSLSLCNPRYIKNGESAT